MPRRRAAMKGEEIQALLSQLSGWEVAAASPGKEYKFKNFRETLDFVNRVGELAEEQDTIRTFALAGARLRSRLYDKIMA